MEVPLTSIHTVFCQKSIFLFKFLQIWLTISGSLGGFLFCEMQELSAAGTHPYLHRFSTHCPVPPCQSALEQI